jgi:predicted acylesterase/phospholipase RssA
VAKADLISSPLAPAIDRAPVNDCRRVRAAVDVPRRPSPASSNDAWQMTPRPPFELCAPLQAGGGFGAYPAGVYEALAEAIRHPNWIACTSIGAVDGALIAGNAND